MSDFQVYSREEILEGGIQKSSPQSQPLWTPPERKFQLLPDIKPFVFNNVPEEGTFEYDLWQQTEQMPDPEEARAKLDVAMAFSNATDIEFKTAYDNVDALVNVFANNGRGGDVVYKRMKNTEARNYLSGTLNIGRVITERGHVGFQMVENGVTEEGLAKIAEIAEQLQKLQASETKNPFLWMVGQAATMWPTMWAGIKQGAQRGAGLAVGFATAALIGGQMGPQIAFPEEIVTVPGAALAGFGVGMSWGTAQETFNVEAGNFFVDMITEGVDANIAQWGALAGGFLSALIETVTVSQIIGSVPGLDKVWKSSINKAIISAAEKVTKSTAGRIALQYEMNVATETGEEVLQELVAISAEYLVKQINDHVHGTEYESAWIGAGDRILETAKSSVAGLSVLGLPGLAGNVFTARPAGTSTDAKKQSEAADWARTIDSIEGTEQAVKFLHDRGITGKEQVISILQDRSSTIEKIYEGVEADVTPEARNEINQTMGMDVYEHIASLEEERTRLDEKYADNPVELVNQIVQKQREIDFLRDEKFRLEIERSPKAWQYTSAEWNAKIEERIKERGELVFSDEFKQKIADHFPQIPEEEVKGVALLVQLRSDAFGMTRDQYLAKAFTPEIFAAREQTELVEQKALKQGKGQVRGAVEFMDDAKALIHASKAADFSTAAHELAHVWRKELTAADLKIAEAWAGVIDGKWTPEQDEMFAKHFEKYLQEGYAPSAELKSVFQKFAQWIRKVFSYIGQRWDLSPEIRGVYDRLFLPGQERGEVAAEGEMLFQTAYTEAEVTVGGNLFKTGVPVTFPFDHNPEKSPFLGSRFQQDIEPAGKYITYNYGHTPESWESGIVTFNNPLVIEFNSKNEISYDKESWKQKLFEEFKTGGRELSLTITAQGYDGVVTVSNNDLSEIVDLTGFEKQSNILYKDFEHERSVREAVEAGVPVPDNVLGEYADQEWAMEEIQARREYSDEATTFDRKDGMDEYVDYMLGMDPIDRPRSYYEYIFGMSFSKSQTDPDTRARGNLRFIESLTKPVLVMYLREMAEQQGFAGYHGIIQSGAKAAKSKDTISDAHYKKIMDQVKADPAFYREEFSILVKDMDELERLTREREADPAVVEIEELRRQVGDLKDNLKKKGTTLENLQEQVYRLNSSVDFWYRIQNEAKEELKTFAEDTQKAESDARKSARQEARLQKEQAVKKAKGEMRESQKARRDARKLTELFHKHVRQIMKKTSAAIQIDSAKEIIAIQDVLALKGPRSREYKDRMHIRAVIEQNPNESFSEAIKQEAARVSVYDLTLREIEDLYERVKFLREEGRVERDLELLDERIWHDDHKGLLLDTLTGEKGGFPPPDENVGSVTEQKKRRTGLFKTIFLLFHRPDRVVEMLDGDEKGPFKELLRDKINDAENNFLVEYHRRREIAEDTMKAYGIKPAEFGKIIKENNVPYTISEIIHFYIALQNEDSQLTLQNGNNIKPSTIEKMLSQLDEKFRKYGEYMISEFSDENFERLNAELRRVENREMVRVEKYFPIRRKDHNYDADKNEFVVEIEDRYGLRKAAPHSGFKIERTHSEGATFIPMKLGAVNLFFDQLMKQEKYIATAEIAKRYNKLFNDTDIVRGIRQKHGDRANEWIQKYLAAWINPNIYKTNDLEHHASRILRHHAALSYLGFNLLTPLKQLPSLAFYLGYAGPVHLMEAVSEMMYKREETVRFIDENDPQVKYRAMNLITEELKLQGRNEYEKFVQKVGKVGMWTIQLMDRQAVLIGWKAVYNKCIADGMSHKKSVRKAQDVTLRTQPQAAAKDLPQAFREKELMRWFFMFGNQLNQIFNMVTWDVPQAFKQKKWGRAIGIISSIAISSLVIGMLSRRRIPDEPEEFYEDILAGLLASVPILGSTMSSVFMGYSATGIQPVPISKEAAKIIKDIGKSFETGQLEVELKGILRLIEAGMIMGGLPTVQPRRVLKTIIEKDPWELIGGQWGEEE